MKKAYLKLVQRVEKRCVGDNENVGGFVVDLDNPGTSENYDLRFVIEKFVISVPGKADLKKEQIQFEGLVPEADGTIIDPDFIIPVYSDEGLSDFFKEVKGIIGTRPFKIRDTAAGKLLSLYNSKPNS
jgi:hypothetical protein